MSIVTAAGCPTGVQAAGRRNGHAHIDSEEYQPALVRDGELKGIRIPYQSWIGLEEFGQVAKRCNLGRVIVRKLESIDVGKALTVLGVKVIPGHVALTA